MSFHTPQSLTVRAADEAAIRTLYRQMTDSWAQGSGDVFAAPFAEDADLVGCDPPIVAP